MSGSRGTAAFALVLAGLVAEASPAQTEPSGCLAPGQWGLLRAGGVERLPVDALFDRHLRGRVVLLGEHHDRAEHHRWQLHTIAGLQTRDPALVLAFEMFPRRVQPVLDAWVAGDLDEDEFLARSRWREVWAFDPQLYLPLFHFARMHRLPMVALNVERTLVGEVARSGWDAVPEARREGVGRPAPVDPAYSARLRRVFDQHPTGPSGAAARSDPDQAFERFLRGQTFWDRAMAEAIGAALERHPGRRVVAVVGSGHAVAGGVPHQLAAIGHAGAVTLLPWDADRSCAALQAEGAHAAFGVTPRAAQARSPAASARPRLGVGLTAGAGGGLRIDVVEPGSIAESAGLRPGDLLLGAAGRPLSAAVELQRIIGRQAPGTWLPLRVKRTDGEIELVARFPP